jgi:hypothetical protein
MIINDMTLDKTEYDVLVTTLQDEIDSCYNLPLREDGWKGLYHEKALILSRVLDAISANTKER